MSPIAYSYTPVTAFHRGSIDEHFVLERPPFDDVSQIQQESALGPPRATNSNGRPLLPDFLLLWRGRTFCQAHDLRSAGA